MSIILTEQQKQIVEKYGHMFNNTGGNDIIELVERKDVAWLTNPIVAELQGCCYAQITIIQRMINDGVLPAL